MWRNVSTLLHIAPHFSTWHDMTFLFFYYVETFSYWQFVMRWTFSTWQSVIWKNLSTWQIFLHKHRLWCLWQIWGMPLSLYKYWQQRSSWIKSTNIRVDKKKVDIWRTLYPVWPLRGEASSCRKRKPTLKLLQMRWISLYTSWYLTELSAVEKLGGQLWFGCPLWHLGWAGRWNTVTWLWWIWEAIIKKIPEFY